MVYKEVKAHVNITLNELADKGAKRGYRLSIDPVDYSSLVEGELYCHGQLVSMPLIQAVLTNLHGSLPNTGAAMHPSFMVPAVKSTMRTKYVFGVTQWRGRASFSDYQKRQVCPAPGCISHARDAITSLAVCTGFSHLLQELLGSTLFADRDIKSWYVFTASIEDKRMIVRTLFPENLRVILLARNFPLKGIVKTWKQYINQWHTKITRVQMLHAQAPPQIHPHPPPKGAGAPARPPAKRGRGRPPTTGPAGLVNYNVNHNLTKITRALKPLPKP